MIKVTDIAGTTVYVNPDLIEKMELVPDTMLTLTTGRRMVVREEPEAVLEEVLQFKRSCHDIVNLLRDEIHNLVEHRHRR